MARVVLRTLFGTAFPETAEIDRILGIFLVVFLVIFNSRSTYFGP